jgi:hypothetical protein
MNQAIFKRLLVRPDGLDADEDPLFAHLHDLVSPSLDAVTVGPTNDPGPHNSGGPGSNVIQMVRMRGLEPPPGFPDTDLNRARLPIPPHPRGLAKISQRGVRVPPARRRQAPWDRPGRGEAISAVC